MTPQTSFQTSQKAAFHPRPYTTAAAVPTEAAAHLAKRAPTKATGLGLATTAVVLLAGVEIYRTVRILSRASPPPRNPFTSASDARELQSEPPYLRSTGRGPKRRWQSVTADGDADPFSLFMAEYV